MLHIVDTIIVCEAPSKTLTSLHDLLVDAPDASNDTDCLRISPWKVVNLQEALREFTIGDLLHAASLLKDEAS